MKCPTCGSKDILEESYSWFCRTCGWQTMKPARSKLDNMSPVGLSADNGKDARSWIRNHIYVLIALMFILGFILAKVTA